MAGDKNRRVVAHLGAHKTATSLIQNYFKNKRPYYLEQGVHFLTRQEIEVYVGWGGKVVAHPERIKEKLDEEFEKTSVSCLLFSIEDGFGRPYVADKGGLYPYHKKAVPAFHEALKEFDIRIVYSIRPQWEFLESYYLQKVNEGYFLTFSQFVKEVDLEDLYWTPIIEKLHAQFGAENVTIMDFGLIRQGQDTFLTEFIEKNLPAGCVPDLNYKKVHNPSISDRGLQMALRVNPLMLTSKEAGLVRRFLQNNFSNRNEPRPILMSETLKQELKDRYQTEYSSLVAG